MSAKQFTRKNNFLGTRLLLALSFLLTTGWTFAQNANSGVGCFIRVQNLQELNDSDKYVLLAPKDEKGFLLTNKYTANKLAAKQTDFAEDSLQNPSADCLWRIYNAGKGLVKLVSLENGSAIGKKNTTDVTFISNPQSSKAASFSISKENGFFIFSTGSGDEVRRFCYNPGYEYFGFFIESPGYVSFYLYKYVPENISGSLSEISPSDTLALTFEDKVLKAESNKFLQNKTTGFRLPNGSLASDTDASFWHLNEKRELEDQDKNTISSIIQQSGSWKKLNNTLALEKDGKVYSFAYNTAGEIQFVPVANIDGLLLHFLTASAKAPEASVQKPAQGLFLLEGGWSMSKLTNMEISAAAREYDFSNALLPAAFPLFDLTNSPNCLLRFSENDSSAISQGQNNAVLRGNGTDKLWGSMILVDKKPYFFYHPFKVRDNQLSYARNVSDNKWNSLLLPFAQPSVPSPLVVAEFTSAASRTSAVFNQTNSILPYKSYLFQLPNTEQETAIKFAVEAQEIPQTPDSLEWLTIGDTLAIGSHPELYVLNNEGTALTVTTSNSFLYPFRGYFNLGYIGQKTLKLVANTSALHPILRETEKSCIYDLQGRLLPSEWGTLPKGIYIKDNTITIK